MDIFSKLPYHIKVHILSFRPTHPIACDFKYILYNNVPSSISSDFIFNPKLFLNNLLGFYTRDEFGNVSFLDDTNFRRVLYIKHSILFDLYKKCTFSEIIHKYDLRIYHNYITLDLSPIQIFKLFNITHKDLTFRNLYFTSSIEFDNSVKTYNDYINYIDFLYNYS